MSSFKSFLVQILYSIDLDLEHCAKDSVANFEKMRPLQPRG